MHSPYSRSGNWWSIYFTDTFLIFSLCIFLKQEDFCAFWSCLTWYYPVNILLQLFLLDKTFLRVILVDMLPQGFHFKGCISQSTVWRYHNLFIHLGGFQLSTATNIPAHVHLRVSSRHCLKCSAKLVRQFTFSGAVLKGSCCLSVNSWHCLTVTFSLIWWGQMLPPCGSEN